LIEPEDNMEIAMHSQSTSQSNPGGSVPLQKTRFTHMLIEENDLTQNGFETWLFCSGMLFNSPDKWWGDRGRRDYPHEGIDFCLYRDRRQRTVRLDETTRIPAMHSGVVRASFKDYLGKAVVIQHEKVGGENARFISMYAHITPRADLEIGTLVQEGDLLGTIADTSSSKARILPHLHFSLGLASLSLSYEGFVWNTIRRGDLITLLDPLSLLDWPSEALAGDHPACLEI
jgi:murein DD-endopeptidase MepM/ murein hydrolase activator NlpD